MSIKELLKITNIKAGTVLKGKTYDPYGELMFDRYHVFTEFDLKRMLDFHCENVFFEPSPDNVSSLVKDKCSTSMEKIFSTISAGKKTNIKEASDALAKLVSEIYAKDTGVINLLNLIENDEYTYKHSVNVGILSVLFAKLLGIKVTEARKMGLGAFLHDIGKINTPVELAWKINSDDEYEKTIIQQHPQFGSKLLKSDSEVPDDVLNIVTRHHENFDGTGYPGKLRDDDINLSCKIVSICNYYCHLTEKAEGKPHIEPREAVLEIKNQSGKMFNPVLVKSFVSELSEYFLNEPIYPLKSLVWLNTNEIAVVEGFTKYSDLKPTVKIITNIQGENLSRPFSVNLNNDPKRNITQIVKTGEA